MTEGLVVRKVRVRAPEGVHLRSAGALASLVKQWKAEVVLRKGDRSANGASVLEILSLVAMEGDELVVEASGPDAEAAAESVQRLIENGFQMPSEENPSPPQW